MQSITAKDNQWLRLARAVASKKGRDEEGCYLIEGLRLCGEALAMGLPIIYVFFSESAFRDGRYVRLSEEAEFQRCRIALVRDDLFEKMCDTEHPQGVAMLLEMPERQPLPKVTGGCYAYTDGIRDPGNLGTIIRSAHAAGLSGLLLSLFMSNAGGLWDNSKKYVESGHEGGKGSDAHKAAVVGDTVGDPFKDTAGPSINTQITVVSLVASLTSALFVAFSIFK